MPRSSAHGLNWINEANFLRQQIFFCIYFFGFCLVFIPDRPRGSVWSWSSWPVKRLEHLADNWRGVFWFLLIYFADKGSPETRSPRRSHLNSNWVHLHRDLASHSGREPLETPLQSTLAEPRLSPGLRSTYLPLLEPLI